MSKNNDLKSRYVAGVGYDMLYNSNKGMLHTIALYTFNLQVGIVIHRYCKIDPKK